MTDHMEDAKKAMLLAVYNHKPYESIPSLEVLSDMALKTGLEISEDGILAALPHIRAQIAADIRAEKTQYAYIGRDTADAFNDGVELAARVAEGPANE